MKKKIRTVLIILLCAALTYGIALTVVPVAVLSGTVHRHYDFKDATAPGGYTEHLLSTADGETVAVYERIPERPDAVVVFLSGMTGPSVTAFSELGTAFFQRNFGAVLLELRGHGASSGKLVGLGYLETEDVKAALRFCQEEKKLGDVPTVLCGVSMGASSALVAMSEFSGVDGAILLSPYVSFEEQFELKAKACFCPPLSRKYATWLVTKFLEHTYGADAVAQKSPRSAAEQVGNRPVLICASEQDRSVPVENTERLAALLQNVTVKTRTSENHLVAAGNRLENAAKDRELMDWLLHWLTEEFEPAAISPAA